MEYAAALGDTGFAGAVVKVAVCHHKILRGSPDRAAAGLILRVAGGAVGEGTAVDDARAPGDKDRAAAGRLIALEIAVRDRHDIVRGADRAAVALLGQRLAVKAQVISKQEGIALSRCPRLALIGHGNHSRAAVVRVAADGGACDALSAHIGILNPGDSGRRQSEAVALIVCEGSLVDGQHVAQRLEIVDQHLDGAAGLGDAVLHRVGEAAVHDVAPSRVQGRERMLRAVGVRHLADVGGVAEQDLIAAADDIVGSVAVGDAAVFVRGTCLRRAPVGAIQRIGIGRIADGFVGRWLGKGAGEAPALIHRAREEQLHVLAALQHEILCGDRRERIECDIVFHGGVAVEGDVLSENGHGIHRQVIGAVVDDGDIGSLRIVDLERGIARRAVAGALDKIPALVRAVPVDGGQELRELRGCGREGVGVQIVAGDLGLVVGDSVVHLHDEVIDVVRLGLGVVGEGDNR